MHNHEIAQGSCTALASQPSQLTPDSLSHLLNIVDNLNVCAGHPDDKFVSFAKGKKGVLKTRDGGVAASLDNYAPVLLNGSLYAQTVRTTSCELLVSGVKCASCQKYRPSLRSAYNRSLTRQSEKITDTSSHANVRYMVTPEKITKMKKVKKQAQDATQEVRRLQKKIEQLTCDHGDRIDVGLHEDLLGIMNEKTKDIQDAYPNGSFGRLFWEEQLRAATVKDPRQVRWHPLIIRWCLNLKLLSGAAYHATRSAGFIKLPSERTLCDYTHYFKNRPGFQKEVNEQLQKESRVSKLSEEYKYCGIVFDEMKIKENLVYDKHTGGVIGFTNLGDINDELLSLEQECQGEQEHAPIANHLLVLMVRGIFFKLNFPYAHFGTEGVTADQLFPIVWEAIRQVEGIGLKVIFITADGASPNRKFFRMHRNPKDIIPTYKTPNPFAQEKRSIFFISDPSHLIKTVRNCWSHSSWNGTRLMTVSTNVHFVFPLHCAIYLI